MHSFRAAAGAPGRRSLCRSRSGTRCGWTGWKCSFRSTSQSTLTSSSSKRNERARSSAPSVRWASGDVRSDENMCSYRRKALGRKMCEHVYAPEAVQETAFQSRSCGPHLQRMLQWARPGSRFGAASAGSVDHEGSRPPGSNFTDQMAVTLSERRRIGPIVVGPRRRKLMEKFVIEGGAPLSGTMVPAGNKNGALPILASCVLTDEEVIVRNVPHIRDVDAMLEILRELGVEVAWRGPNEVALCAANVNAVEIDRDLAEQIRASFLLAGPLLARFHRAVMPPPGGDVIGRRRLDPHLDAFRAMGATVEANGGIRLAAPKGLCPTDVFMDEPSVMATENALMAAALIPGTTVIGNAAS